MFPNWRSYLAAFMESTKPGHLIIHLMFSRWLSFHFRGTGCVLCINTLATNSTNTIRYKLSSTTPNRRSIGAQHHPSLRCGETVMDRPLTGTSSIHVFRLSALSAFYDTLFSTAKISAFEPGPLKLACADTGPHGISLSTVHKLT